MTPQEARAWKAMSFMETCTTEETLIILECALAGLRDELSDGFLRENRILDLDLNDEALQPLYDRLARYLEAEGGVNNADETDDQSD